MQKQCNQVHHSSTASRNIHQTHSDKRIRTTISDSAQCLAKLSALFCWCYSGTVWALSECGPVSLETSCFPNTTYSYIEYYPEADFTLIIGPNVTVTPPFNRGGITIHNADIAYPSNLSLYITGSTITTQNINGGIYGDGILLYQKSEGNISIFAEDVTIATSRSSSGSSAVSTGIVADLAENTSVGDISIQAIGGSITTTGDNSYGLYGLHYGQGNISITTSSQITTSGESTDGIVANRPNQLSTGPVTITQSGGTISTTGKWSNGIGIYHSGVGDTIATAAGKITTQGDLSRGIEIIHYSNSNPTLSNITIQLADTAEIVTMGDGAFGIDANHKDDGPIEIEAAAGSTIETSGTGSHGVKARTSGNSNISLKSSGSSITTRGDGAVGLLVAPQDSASPETATITSGTISTGGNSSHGIVAGTNDVGSDTSVFNRTNVATAGTITTTGTGSAGVVAVSASDTTVSVNAAINASGKFSTGVLATSTGGTTVVDIAQGESITGGWQDTATDTSGQRFNTQSAGIIMGGATAQLTNRGIIGAMSDRSVGVSNVFTPAPGDVVIDNYGTITGYLSMEAVGRSTFNNYSPTSFVLRHFADTDGDGVRDTKAVAISDFGGAGSVFNNLAQGMVRFGEVTTNTTTDTTGQYLPTTGIDNRPLDASIYSITRPGVVQGQLVNLSAFNHAGIIDLRGPYVGNVLAITGNANMTTSVTPATRGTFISNGGELISNVARDGTSQPNPYADMLIVDSTQMGTGATQVTIHDRGGLGGLTVENGIEIVEVRDKTPGASASGVFTLAAPVAAGAYSYQLHQNGINDDASDGNWYLRSNIPNPDIPNPDIPNPNILNPGVSSPGMPNPAGASPKTITTYRPQVPVYMAAQALTSRMGLDMLGTYHDRLGEDYSHTTQATGTYSKTGWGRIYGGNLKTRLSGNAAGRLDQFEHYGSALTLNNYGFQTGADLYRRPHKTYSDVAGAYVGYNHGKADVQHVLNNSDAGTIDLDTFGLGGYWTRKGDSGWYIDGVLQGSFYHRIKAESQGQRLSTRGWGLIASAEAGYPINVGASWKLEPQAQIIYQHIKLDNKNDDFGKVFYSSQDTVHARLGARLDKTFTNATNQQFTPWLRANLWFSPEHDASTTFTTTAGTHATALNTSLGGKWMQLGAGLSGQVRQNISVFASADYNHNIGGQKARGISGRIGLKIAF